MLDIVDNGREVALCDADDAVSHLFRHQTVVVPDDTHDWDIDIREDIGGRALNRHDAHSEDQNGHHHKGVGPAQC